MREYAAFGLVADGRPLTAALVRGVLFLLALTQAAGETRQLQAGDLSENAVPETRVNVPPVLLGAVLQRRRRQVLRGKPTLPPHPAQAPREDEATAGQRTAAPRASRRTRASSRTAHPQRPTCRHPRPQLRRAEHDHAVTQINTRCCKYRSNPPMIPQNPSGTVSAAWCSGTATTSAGQQTPHRATTPPRARAPERNRQHRLTTATPEPGYLGPMTDRDRDNAGRARNARPRDAYGRPLPRDAVGEPTISDSAAAEFARNPPTALAEAQRLLDADRPFHAHEVLEAVWKSAPDREREMWRGLAQLAVGLTHLRRGNPVGAGAVFTRAADLLAADPGAGTPYGLDLLRLVADVRTIASRIEMQGADQLAPRLVLVSRH